MPRGTEYFYSHWVRQMLTNKKRIGQDPGLATPVIPPVIPSTWDIAVNAANFSFSNGDRDAANSTGTQFSVCLGETSHDTVGKFYFEVTLVVLTAGTDFVGIATAAVDLLNTLGHDALGWGYYDLNGRTQHNNVTSVYGAAYAQGDVIGVIVDFDTPEIRFTKNGVDQGQAYNAIGATVFPAACTTSMGDEFLIATSLAQFQFFPGAPYTAWG